MQDSTPIIEAMETRFPEPALQPADPALAFVSALVEEYGDEWGNKPMFHYRWFYEADADSAGERIARAMNPSLDAEGLANVVPAVKGRMIPRLSFVGSSPETKDTIEGSFRRQVAILEKHLEGRPYLFGGRPALGDFGLFAQLYECWTDPTPGAHIRATAPRVQAWIERMLDPAAQGDFEPWARLEPTFLPFLRDEVGAVFFRGRSRTRRGRGGAEQMRSRSSGQAVHAGAAEVPREVARRAARALRQGGGSRRARSHPRAGRLPRGGARELTAMARRRLALVAALALVLAACAGVWRRGPYHGTTERIAYGRAPSNVAELRVPAGPGPHPVVVMLHCGYYQRRYAADYFVPLAEALTTEGFATWNVEFRRLGEDGAGYPGTFRDVADATNLLARLAPSRRLDLAHVTALGHSAGGQLALTLASASRLRFAPSDAPVRITRVVARPRDRSARHRGSEQGYDPRGHGRDAVRALRPLRRALAARSRAARRAAGRDPRHRRLAPAVRRVGALRRGGARGGRRRHARADPRHGPPRRRRSELRGVAAPAGGRPRRGSAARRLALVDVPGEARERGRRIRLHQPIGAA
jgi:acetyl esterase/lipase/glutathione S-transferase